MEEIHRETATEGLTLERLFLRLTGGEVVSELGGILDD
jgi:hypothetical protein